MEQQHKIDYISPAITVLFLGLIMASFSQSCSATKASISEILVSPKMEIDHTSFKPIIKPLEASYLPVETLISVEGQNPSEGAKKDTTNYSQQILDNQELSLLNEKRILELLVAKDQENRKLKAKNGYLQKKGVVSQQEKNDAEAMKAIWKTGEDLLTVGAAIIVLLIIQICFMVWGIRKKSRGCQ